MRRVISFVLMMVLLLSLACPAFATTVNSIPNQPPVIGGNPKTGDVIMTWVVVLAVSALALTAVIIYRKKFA